ncbi:MAG TPA: DUF2059 domain-containing protein [Rhizomicrobium sp.]|jgi:hypothetical protein
MFKSVVAAFVLVLASSGAGLADDAPPSVAQPALEALKSDPHVAKAMEFLEASGSKDAMLQRTDIMVDAIIEQLRRNKNDVPDKVWDVMRSTIKDELRAGADDLLLASAKIYSRHFSDAELDELIAFYKSDAGVKYLHERQSIVQEEAAFGKEWAARMEPVVMDKIIRKLREVGDVNKEQKS